MHSCPLYKGTNTNCADNHTLQVESFIFGEELDDIDKEPGLEVDPETRAVLEAAGKCAILNNVAKNGHVDCIVDSNVGIDIGAILLLAAFPCLWRCLERFRKKSKLPSP